MRFTVFGKSLLFLAAFTTTLLAQSFSGAIYTSLGDGATVNQNTYALKSDVYLNGGPQNTSSAGLPDGIYYYQVTDPSGKSLLSTDDAVCRQVQVVGGVIFGAVSSGTMPECMHADGLLNPANGSKPVQLIPYLDTPNGGGEYKVWLIAQNLGTACTASTVTVSGAVITFPSKCAKTDNFKVEERDEPPPPCDPNCEEPDEYTISGLKYYDTNANTVRDEGEPPIQGFRFDMAVTSSGLLTRTSGADGTFSFGPVFEGDAYEVCEILPSPNPDGSYWIQTGPVADSQGKQCYSGNVGTANITGLEFGNLCLQPGTGGFTLGFWSNRNGERRFADVVANYPGGAAAFWLYVQNSLHLKNADGTDFNPTTYAQIKPWLLGGTATNMAYMLSVQMFATWLNVQAGTLDGDRKFLTENFGQKTANELIELANAALFDLVNPVIVLAGDPRRANMENLKNEFDAINNNELPFVKNPGQCAVTYIN